VCRSSAEDLVQRCGVEHPIRPDLELLEARGVDPFTDESESRKMIIEAMEGFRDA